MRIAIDMSHVRKIKTGIATYTNNIIKALKEQDKENKYFYFWAPSCFKSKNFFTRIINAFLDVLWRQIILPLKLSWHKIDILYCPSFYTPLISRAKIVVAIFDIIFLHYPKEHGLLWTSYLKYSTKIAVKKADKIITTSEFSKKDIIENFKAAPGTFEIIPGAINEKFKVIDDESFKSEFRRKYNIKNRFFMYAGALNSHKNPETLIRSFFEFKKDHNNFKEENFNLILAGSGKTPPEIIQNLIKELNLENNIISIGYMPEDDLVMLYNTAEIFIFPSLHEGFGLPPLEAMACGTPVVSSNATSLPEVISDAGILLSPKDIKGFANAYNKILSNTEFTNQLIQKGLNRTKEFSWEKSAQKLLEIFKEI